MEDRKAQCTQVQTHRESERAVYKVQPQEAKLKRKLTFFFFLSLQNRVGLKGCSHFGKSGRSSKLFNVVTLWPSNSTPRNIYPKELRNMTTQKLPMNIDSSRHNSQKDGNNPSPSTEEGINDLWYNYKMKYYSALKGNEVLHATSGWTLKKLCWKKPGHKRLHILHIIWFHSYEWARKGNQAETESRLVGALG